MVKNILIAEDDPNVLSIMCKQLEIAQYNITTAKNGKETLEKLKNPHDYDLLILDIDIPPPDGLKICRSLREKDENIPIIFLTGKVSFADKIWGEESGCNAYITKPYTQEELLDTVAKLIN